MKLFPMDTPEFYSDKGKIIKSKLEDFHTKSMDYNQTFWHQANIDARFEAGDQTIWDEIYNNIPIPNRATFNFNKIRRIINMISGYQRRNRKSLIVIPVENGDQQTADQYSKIINHINRKEAMLETVSDAFHDAIVTGLSLLYVWNDYRQDPVSGSIKIDNCAYDSLFLDPFFKKSDLSDCSAIWKRSLLSKQQVKSLLPDKSKMLDEICNTNIDNKFPYMPGSGRANAQGLISYDEYYYTDTRSQKLLIDTQTGETMEWKESNQEGLSQFLSAYPTVIVSEHDIQTVKLAILVNGVLVYDGHNLLGTDKYPFVPVFGYFNPNIDSYSLKLQGVVRGLRDAQWLSNRFVNIALDSFESQTNSGWIYKENALVDKDDVYLKAGQGKGIALNQDAQMTDIQKIPTAEVSQSLFSIIDKLDSLQLDISGANEELLGSAVDDKAGILSMLRQGAGLTTLQTLYDQLDRSQKLLGTVLIDAIQSNYTPGKIKRILAEEPLPQFYNKAFGIYDSAVEEGFNTTTQKQLEFAQLIKLKELGLNIPDSAIIEAATLQNKQNLIKSMEQIQQQQQQQEQQAAQMQQALQAAQTELAKAKVESDRSLAKERDSRVFSNIGLMKERELEAEKDKTQSMLNLVKTLQEIDNIDIEQLTKLIQVSQTVNAVATEGNKVEKMGAAIVSGATSDTSVGNNPKGV